MNSFIILFITTLLVGVSLGAGRPFTATDLNTIPRVGSPVPDSLGENYVVSVNTWDMNANKKTQSFWLGKVNSASGLTPLAAQNYVIDSNPVWSPDSKTVFFLSDRSGASEIWAVRISDGSSYKVSSFPVDVDTFKLNAQANMIAFSAQVYPGLTLAQTAAKDQVNANSRIDAHRFDRLFIRRWDANNWYFGKFAHLHVAKLSYNPSSDVYTLMSTATDVMTTMEGDCPSKPFGGPEEYDFSPDGNEVAFTTQLGLDTAWSTDLNVYITAIGGTPTCITCFNKATDTTPVYSPDSKYIAYLSMRIPGYESDTKAVTLYDRATKEITVITPDWALGVEGMYWTTDSSAIMGTVWDTARQRLYKIDINTWARTMILVDHFNDGMAGVPCPDAPTQECIIFSRSDFAHPTEIFISTSAPGSFTQLTHFTDVSVQDIQFSQWVEFHSVGALGDDILSWFLLPYGFNPTKSYPLVLYIHGGPEDPWFDQWHPRWNAQTIAAAGYAVLAVNPHGSSSFGANFTQAILNDWGGKPYVDLMTSVDAVLQAYPWIDGSRLGAMGASYGGYMINWINTQTTRFKALVCHDGLWDTEGMFYMTDELFFPTMENGGLPPYVDESPYRKFSPMAHAAGAKTPQLTFHGSHDYRIPDVSGIGAFTNLQRQGIPSALVLFPNEDHFVLNPNNSIFWHQTIIDWLNKYIQ